MQRGDRGVRNRYQVYIPSFKIITGRLSIVLALCPSNTNRDCGFLRYWKLSNVPLFLLATPMFCILMKSGLWAWTFSSRKSPTTGKEQADQVSASADAFNFVRSFGVSQLLLTALTLTTAHVQIITRISSAYPVWLWYVAISAQKSNGWMVGHMVQFVVMYAVVQGGLFASFLPPA